MCSIKGNKRITCTKCSSVSIQQFGEQTMCTCFCKTLKIADVNVLSRIWLVIVKRKKIKKLISATPLFFPSIFSQTTLVLGNGDLHQLKHITFMIPNIFLFNICESQLHSGEIPDASLCCCECNLTLARTVRNPKIFPEMRNVCYCCRGNIEQGSK